MHTMDDKNCCLNTVQHFFVVDVCQRFGTQQR
jgi:hypothetical protein